MNVHASLDIQEMLRAAATGLQVKRDVFADIMARELSKSTVDGGAEIDRTIETFQWHANVDTNSVFREEIGQGHRHRIWQPAGQCAAIVPWNFPLLLTARKVASALIGGNRVVVLASPGARRSIAALVDLMHASGIGHSQLNLHPDTPERGLKELLSNEQVQRISFTGSTAVGRLIAQQAAEKLVPCVLELGGHAPVLVHDDVDISSVISKLVPFKLHFAGQSCAAPGRIVVADGIFERFTATLQNALNAIAPDTAGANGGPLPGLVYNNHRAQALKAMIADARQHSEAVWQPDWCEGINDDRFVAPTLVLHPEPEAVALTEEPFGPILTLQSASSVDHMLSLANQSQYALNAFVFANCTTTRDTLANGVNAGTVTCNRFAGVEADVGQAGQLASGYGFEGGIEGIRAFCDPKLVRL